jgi:hypothetical protein
MMWQWWNRSLSMIAETAIRARGWERSTFSDVLDLPPIVAINAIVACNYDVSALLPPAILVPFGHGPQRKTTGA